jgi:16S rRNA (uracil1498-N3)-methyltransferase
LDIFGKSLFYLPDLTGTELILSEEESRHCIGSLRKQEKESIFLTDGKGNLVQAEIVKAHPKATLVHVSSRETQSKPKMRRRLVVAPPKTGERLDWMVEKVTEIGVDEIQFIATRYSERDKLNVERLQKIAISAMKQSKQLYLPLLEGMIPWKQFVASPLVGKKCIAYIPPAGQVIESLGSYLKKEGGHSDQIIAEWTILIGPEGDFSSEEAHQAMEKGFEPVSLGKTILRTETAAIYSLACFNAFA